MAKNYRIEPYQFNSNSYSWNLRSLHSARKPIKAISTTEIPSLEFWQTAYGRDKKSYTKNCSGRLNKESHFNSIWKIIETYLKDSTLHGLRYVGDNTIPYTERLIWLIIFLCALTCAVYLITIIYAKYSANSIIVNINPIPTPVRDVPFPAVTVCNMNLIKKSKMLNATFSNGYSINDNFLGTVCEFSNPLLHHLNIEENESLDLSDTISKISQPCDKMLLKCKWLQQDIDCNRLFNPTLTDEGLCCTFNQLPMDYILRDAGSMIPFHSTYINKYDKLEIDNWNPEKGYSRNASHDVFPFRSRGPGAHLGLAIVMDTDISNYYCSSTSTFGIKVLLHNPAEIPIMQSSAFMLPSGLVVRAVFKPVINDATVNLQTADISKRQCYFTHEKYLKYFKTYTTTNCKLECLANITVKRCGCALHYLPRSESMKLCGKKQENCTNVIEDMMQIQQIVSQEEKLCNCLPACFQLTYEKSMSYAQFPNSSKVPKQFASNLSATYFVNNMVSFQLYFVTTHFRKFTRSNSFGFSEFISNTGGILGLFLGFGCLSVVEILYHCTLKWLCNDYRLKRKYCQQKTAPLLIS